MDKATEISKGSDQELPSLSALISDALKEKLEAISGYDDIIWKIRAGYLAILYGSIGLFLGTNGISDIGGLISDQKIVIILVLTVLGLSLSAYQIDSTYTLRKLKVIVTRDLLIDFILHEQHTYPEYLPQLLRVSGEIPGNEFHPKMRKLLEIMRVRNALWILYPIYTTPPILMACMVLIAAILPK
jgi:hypothetical protein